MKTSTATVRPLLPVRGYVLTVPPASAAERVLDYRLRNRERFAPAMPEPPEDYWTVGGWQRRLSDGLRDLERQEALRFYLFEGDEDRGDVCASVTYSGIVRGPFQACYLGYEIDGRHGGRGVMSDAVRVANAYVFGTLGLHRIMANYVPTNVASGRLLRRLGFTVEGYARDYLRLAGNWEDHILTALVRPDPP